MKTLALVLVGALLIVVWAKSRSARVAEAARNGGPAAAAQVAPAATEDENGWAAVPMPSGTNNSRVVVFSALNCPKAAAQRALAIVQELGERGVPCEHTDHVNFSETTDEQNAKLTKVMNAGPPVVFVKGKAKAWPLVDEIVAEYQAGR